MQLNKNVFRGLLKRAQLLWNLHNSWEICTTPMNCAPLYNTVIKLLKTLYPCIYIYMYMRERNGFILFIWRPFMYIWTPFNIDSSGDEPIMGQGTRCWNGPRNHIQSSVKKQYNNPLDMLCHGHFSGNGMIIIPETQKICKRQPKTSSTCFSILWQDSCLQEILKLDNVWWQNGMWVLYPCDPSYSNEIPITSHSATLFWMAKFQVCGGFAGCSFHGQPLVIQNR